MKVLEKVNENWWWVEANSELGYAPANHLSSEHPMAEDVWQNDEYFSSYEALVSSHLPYQLLAIACTCTSPQRGMFCCFFL